MNTWFNKLFVEQMDESIRAVRTKHSHPYNYDPVLQFLRADVEADSTIYTDRLPHWDYEKYNRLSMQVFGNVAQYWDERKHAKIEEFLRLWTDDPNLVLQSVTEYCNQATGYPVWRLDYRKGKE